MCIFKTNRFLSKQKMSKKEEEIFVLTRLCHMDVWILDENYTVILGNSAVFNWNSK